jgi:hypothetical protein
MNPVEQLTALYVVEENSAELLYALEDLGFTGMDVKSIDGGYALYLDETMIAAGLDEDPVEAINDLLDRAADLFYHEIKEV